MMSMSLHVIPIIDRKAVRLHGEMKRIIGKRFWDNDGSMGGPKTIVTMEQKKTIAFFQGLMASGNSEVSKDATTILEMLGHHGKIELRVQE